MNRPQESNPEELNFQVILEALTKGSIRQQNECWKQLAQYICDTKQNPLEYIARTQAELKLRIKTPIVSIPEPDMSHISDIAQRIRERARITPQADARERLVESKRAEIIAFRNELETQNPQPQATNRLSSIIAGRQERKSALERIRRLHESQKSGR